MIVLFLNALYPYDCYVIIDAVEGGYKSMKNVEVVLVTGMSGAGKSTAMYI